MKDRPTANVTTIRNLKKEKNHAIKERDSLKKQKEKLKKQNDQFQSKNDDLESTIRKLKKDMDLQRAKIKELEMECQQAITLKDDYDRLTHESDELKQQNKEQGELINKLRDMLSEYSSALDLTRGFPPVQDIVNDFGTLKSQYYVEAAKQMRKVLLKQRHKEYSKLRHYKCVCEILFDILIKSYDVMKQFAGELHRDIAASNGLDMDNAKHMKRVERNVKEVYRVLIDLSTKEKARAILDDVKAHHEMNEYLTDDTKLLKYTEECVAVCWLIVLVRVPMLRIEPQEFDQSNQGITFNERLHIEGFGSEDNETLNFVVWPCIVRRDTKYNI